MKTKLTVLGRNRASCYFYFHLRVEKIPSWWGRLRGAKKDISFIDVMTNDFERWYFVPGYILVGPKLSKQLRETCYGNN